LDLFEPLTGNVWVIPEEIVEKDFVTDSLILDENGNKITKTVNVA